VLEGCGLADVTSPASGGYRTRQCSGADGGLAGHRGSRAGGIAAASGEVAGARGHDGHGCSRTCSGHA
jgi:hypothetical protein